MPDLIAQGSDVSHRWRRTLEEGRTYIIGRAAGTWSAPWDSMISRRHAEVCWRDGQLHVRLLPEARNPIFVRGREQRVFTLHVGEHFVIGGTSFTLSNAKAEVSVAAPQPVAEKTFSAQFLQRARFHRTDQRIDVLSRLPEVIRGANNDSELFVRLVNVLMAGIPGASEVAIVAVDAQRSDWPIRVLHWDRRMLVEGDFTPSERLIRQAIMRQESVVHVWRPGAASDAAYTHAADSDWAFCTPVPGEACRGWGIYVAGRGPEGGSDDRASDPSGLRDDLKFTELAATTLCNLREMRLLERRQSGLRQFFSPVVLETLADQDPEIALAPREADVTVLFCDLRGFSLRAEMEADNLMGLLRRVSRALGVVTHHVLDHGGVIGDFHGDAAMGFWGWPMSQPDDALRACRAALAIRADFAQAVADQDPELADFQVGIGIATGRAVAGKIGTIDQVKVTVFGPVVNLASRLETMTKTLHASILVDETTRGRLGEQWSPQLGRFRRVARVRPFGLHAPLTVSELLPPADEGSTLTDEHIAAYEEALDALQAKEWNRAFQLLHRVPAEDRVKDFLTVWIARHNRVAPPDWDGVIPMESK